MRSFTWLGPALAATLALDGGCATAPAVAAVEPVANQIVTRADASFGGRRTASASTAPPYPRARDARSYAARAAAEEAQSVVAFLRLALELEGLGAPTGLIERALAAARDEVVHAALFARRAGAPTPVVVDDRRPPRTALEVARENAREGCVLEAFAATLACVQATAAAAELAQLYRRVATDECRHADLAWDVARWLEPRLSAAERALVDADRRAALHALPPVVALRCDQDHRAAPGFGVPDAAAAAALATAFVAAVSSEAARHD